MSTFFSVGKLLTLGFWLLPAGGLLKLFGEPLDGYFVIAGIVLLLAHALELALNYGKLKAKGRAEPMDVILVLLAGLFHWMPILRQPGNNR